MNAREQRTVQKFFPIQARSASFDVAHLAVCRVLLGIEFFHNPKRQRGMNT